MTEIIIICGNSDERARRIAELFNDGNRVHVAAIIHPDTPLSAPGETEWLVLDDCTPPEVAAELYGDRIISLAPDRTAPMAATDIIAAIRGAKGAAEDPDAAWARTLGVKYDAERAKSDAGVNASNPETQNSDKPLPPPVPEQQQVSPKPSPASHFPSGGVNTRPGGTQQGNGEHVEPMPSNYLIWAILCTVICCLPAGVVAIIFSTRVSSKYYMGDFEGARKASETTQLWIIISFVLGVLSNTLYLPMAIAGWVG